MDLLLLAATSTTPSSQTESHTPRMIRKTTSRRKQAGQVTHPQIDSSPRELVDRASRISAERSTIESEKIRAVNTPQNPSQNSYLQTIAFTPPSRTRSSNIRATANTSFATNTFVKQQSTNLSNSISLLDQGIINADDLERILFGAAQVMNYHGPRNPIDKRLQSRFPSEDPYESEPDTDEEDLPRGGWMGLWSDDWWAEIGEINGSQGRNYVKEKKQRDREQRDGKKG
jgi:hypothetical protein